MDILRYVEIGAVLVAVSSPVIATEVIKSDLRKLEHMGLYELVEIVADSDRNGTTSIVEWENVYKKIGVHFNELNPRELSIEDLKRYLGTDINL